MSFLNAILMGILQGLTEFLPVSSSGHLVLAQHFLGVKESGNIFSCLLHSTYRGVLDHCCCNDPEPYYFLLKKKNDATLL